ncbi:MAG TPA: NAD+ synthase [Bryobacterales bacterium]|nr:NAD+ synthase [Bryobacterales bacterium]
MKIALGQINPTVGDLAGNASRMVRFAREAAQAEARLIIFPELSLSGYPPRDLVEKPSFLDQTQAELSRLAQETASLPLDLICGFPRRNTARTGKTAANCAAYIAGGEVRFTQQKMLLPTYDVFDESRNFAPGEKETVFETLGCKLAITICEDVWNDKQFWERQLYPRDPVEELMAARADLLINISSSPYHMHKRRLRREMLAAIACRHQTPVVLVNQVGGNDQLVFDGTSFVLDAQGRVRALAKSFEEDLVFYDTETNAGDQHETLPDEREAVYQALVLGTRDYVRKCGFERVLLGLSGGIDSSLTAVIAVDAVGAGNVTGVAMPGPYSSEGSVRDARTLAEKLGIRFQIIDINKVYGAFRETLEPVFAGHAPDVTEENLQARLRGATLMALSNKFRALVLTTGNKSELAVGYCTLYGDMCGGLAVISDVPKVMVYELARVANCRHDGAIPEAVFTKPPSAELRPGQKDSDSIPEYDILDPILKAYIEDNEPAECIARRLNRPLELVRRIARLVDRNEYKRQQAAPGLRVTSKAFGMGRRFPIAQTFEE